MRYPKINVAMSVYASFGFLPVALAAEYLMQRHTFRQSERKLAEDAALLRATAMTLESGLHFNQASASEELRVTKLAAQQDARALKATIQSRTELHADEVKLGQAKHHMEVRELNGNIESLTKQLQDTKNK